MLLKKYSFLLFAFCSSIPLFSQFNTYSPYTRFALGDLSKNGFSQNLAMGGTGLAVHEGNRINYLNPAGYAALDSTSVYFDFGVSAFFNQYRFEDQSSSGAKEISNTWWNMNLHHVAFASSMGKFLGFSAGILPYSSIGYSIKQEYNDYLSGNAMDTYYSGDGGIMNFYLGASVKFLKRFSAGVNMNYLMGRLTRERTVEFPANPDYSTASSREDFDLRKPVFSFGLQYRQVFDDRFFFTLGGIYDMKANTSAELKYEVKNTVYLYEPIRLSDSVTITPDYILGSDTISRDFAIPQRFGAGIALGIPGKLTFTGDYYIQDWTGALSGENYKTTQSSSLHLGAEYLPDAKQ